MRLVPRDESGEDRPDVELDRRQLLLTGSACLAWGRSARADGTRSETPPLDRLLEAHAGALPERAGAGANHYPMAAEALETLGHEDAVADAWVEGARGYAGELPRAAPIEGDGSDALGDYERRFGDWLDRFRRELADRPWRTVVAAWVPVLAPGLAGATFHGLIRTGHAARALRRTDTAARRGELAVGLAYWASRYTALPTHTGTRAPARELRDTLQGLQHPWHPDEEDVGFSEVLDRLTAVPLAPPIELEETGATAQADLDHLVREAALAFLEMLVLEQQRIWLLHTVTGPAAVVLLLPDVDEAGARRLVAHARQAVVALHAAYGAPYVPGAHLRDEPEGWPALIRRAAASGSVHTIKLIEALTRFDPGNGDPLCRSVAAQWLAWR